MAKTQKELAFLLDMSVAPDWTQRFADLVDKHIDLDDSDNLLYINAGTGGHAMALQERFGEKTDVFATCETEEILNIALDKAAALSSNVDLSMIRFEDDAFDTVIADASLVRPADLETFVENATRVARTGGDVAVFLPTSGSFGEIASLLWEVLASEDLADHSEAAEHLIADLPKIGDIKKWAADAGLVNLQTETSSEAFEFENGVEFAASPLVNDFLFPLWLENFDEDEKERVLQRLAQLIDDEEGTMSFRFTIKATLLTGEKA